MDTSDWSAPSDQPADGDQAALIDALAQVAFVTMAVLNKIGAEHDLSLTQLRVFGILRDRRLKMTELADYLGLDKSTMTGLVDRATKRGILERAPNRTDGRAVDVFLSTEGTELSDRLHALFVQSLAPRTSTLTRTDRNRLQTLLEQLLNPR